MKRQKFWESCIRRSVRQKRRHLLGGDRLGEVTGEVDIHAVHDGQVWGVSSCSTRLGVRELTIGQQLQGQDIDEALETVDCPGNTDDLGRLGNRVIVVVADDDWTLALQ